MTRPRPRTARLITGSHRIGGGPRHGHRRYNGDRCITGSGFTEGSSASWIIDTTQAPGILTSLPVTSLRPSSKRSLLFHPMQSSARTGSGCVARRGNRA
jgi:hypothetical protein